jgi:hypothetical protein
LNDVDYKLPSLGESAIDAIGRMDKLFSSMHVVEASDDVKCLPRSIDSRAPFYRQRNGIDDAILVEMILVVFEPVVLCPRRST